MTRLIAFAFLSVSIGIPRTGSSQPPNDISPTLPETARSTTEIDHTLDSKKGFGQPQSVRLNSHGRHLFIIWNCPYSGVDLNHVWAYYFDGRRWIEFYKGGIHAAPPAVSPYLDDTGDQLIIDGRRPADRIVVPLKSIPTAGAPPKTDL
jgi:hypothetical protein